jgi:hypothetical protein
MPITTDNYHNVRKHVEYLYSQHEAAKRKIEENSASEEYENNRTEDYKLNNYRRLVFFVVTEDYCQFMVQNLSREFFTSGSYAGIHPELEDLRQVVKILKAMIPQYSSDVPAHIHNTIKLYELYEP